MNHERMIIEILIQLVCPGDKSENSVKIVCSSQMLTRSVTAISITLADRLTSTNFKFSWQK